MIKGKQIITNSKNSKGRVKEFLQSARILLGLTLLCVFFSITANNFLTQRNLINVVLQSSIIAIVAFGQTYVITGGCIDLSVGSIVGLSSVSVAIFMTKGMSIPLAIALAIALGLLCGAVNGSIVAYGNITPFIATLGTQSIIRGIIYVICDGIPVINLPSEFGLIGSARINGLIPLPVILMLVIAVIVGIVYHKSKLGRHIFGVGSNSKAAHLSGVNVRIVQMKMYLMSSGLSAIAGIILAARLISGQPNSGEAYETDAIASAVIGGASMAGGQGSIVGTLIGSLIMGTLSNGLNMMGLDYFYQKIAIGAVIIGAVYLDMLRNKKR